MLLQYLPGTNLARALYSSLIQTFGCPERILIDWGAAFESLLIRAVPALRMSEEPHHGIPPPGKRSLREIQPNRVEAVKLPNRDRPGTVAQPAAGPHPGIYQHHPQYNWDDLHYVVFGRHARLPVDWAYGLSPTVEPHTLQGWVKRHQKALSHAYQAAKKQSQHRQERDQIRYNR